jgi:hypothetical protein
VFQVLSLAIHPLKRWKPEKKYVRQLKESNKRKIDKRVTDPGLRSIPDAKQDPKWEIHTSTDKLPTCF